MKHYQNKETGEIVLGILLKLNKGYEFKISSNGIDLCEGYGSYIYLSKRHFKLNWCLTGKNGSINT